MKFIQIATEDISKYLHGLRLPILAGETGVVLTCQGELKGFLVSPQAANNLDAEITVNLTIFGFLQDPIAALSGDSFYLSHGSQRLIGCLPPKFQNDLLLMKMEAIGQ